MKIATRVLRGVAVLFAMPVAASCAEDAYLRRIAMSTRVRGVNACQTADAKYARLSSVIDASRIAMDTLTAAGAVRKRF